ncbi:MAG: AAA family ATPase [Burkholderiales bacterium]
MATTLAPVRAALQLRGAPACTVGDATAVPLEPMDALLLAYLCIEGATSRATLASLLWPEVEGARARGNLRQRLLRLRQAIGAVVVGNAQLSIAGHVSHDAASEGELLACVTLAQAAGLADWLDAQRSAQRSAHREALAARASQLESERRIAEALVIAHRLVDDDPASEHAHRRVMRLHYLRGDRAAALAAFDRCCDVLERVLGIAPQSETEALRRRIEASPPPATDGVHRPLPVSVLRPPQLIGRAPEWAALATGWAAGAVTTITGEAGMGKTRLTTDFAQAQPGALMLDARPGDARTPYALLVRLLRSLLDRSGGLVPPGTAAVLARLLPELGPAERVSADAEPVRLVSAVEALVMQAHAEGVSGLIVDDLQFADAASVDMLRHVLAAPIALRWIVAWRPVELGAEAQALQDELHARPNARALVLQALDEARVAELVDSLGIAEFDGVGLAGALVRHTGGNPLYLLETLKLMLAPRASAGALATLPTAVSVRRLIGQRIAQLSVMAIKLARCAAIAGVDFSSELAAHVLGVRALDLADAWAELESAQVLRDAAFTHDLIAESARDSVPEPIARQLHAEIAAFLEARHVEPGRVTQHWLDAGEAARALPSLLAAADRAESAWRVVEGARLLTRAAQITVEIGGDRAAAFALLRRADQAHARADLGSLEHVAVLAALEASAGDPLERALARLARCEMQAQQGDGAAAEASARACLHIIADESSAAAHTLRIDLTVALANALMMLERPVDAIDALREAEPRLLVLADQTREMNHFNALGVALDVAGRHAQAEQAHRHTLALARALRDRSTELTTLNNLSISLAETGRIGAALEPLREVLRQRAAAPELNEVGLTVEAAMGDVLCCLGEYRESLAWLERAVPIVSARAPGFVAGILNHQARAWLHLGQPARAWQALQRALKNPGTPQSHRAMTHLLLARYALAQAQPAQAVREIGAARALLKASARYAVFAQAELLATHSADPSDAYRRATEIVLEAGVRQMQGVRMAALSCAARGALACGHTGAAVAHAAEALALWPEHMPDGPYLGEVWLVAAQCLQAAQDPRLAEVLASATVWITRTAREHVPEECRESFLNRNTFNGDLLALAGRHDAGAAHCASGRRAAN